MKNPVTRPKFYAQHQEILRETLLEPKQVQLYLHENMLKHFGDIGDLADCL